MAFHCLQPYSPPVLQKCPDLRIRCRSAQVSNSRNRAEERHDRDDTGTALFIETAPCIRGYFVQRKSELRGGWCVDSSRLCCVRRPGAWSLFVVKFCRLGAADASPTTKNSDEVSREHPERC
jgi:hypothetical protein